MAMSQVVTMTPLQDGSIEVTDGMGSPFIVSGVHAGAVARWLADLRARYAPKPDNDPGEGIAGNRFRK